MAPCVSLALVRCHPSQDSPSAVCCKGAPQVTCIDLDFRRREAKAHVLALGSQPEPPARARAGWPPRSAPVPFHLQETLLNPLCSLRFCTSLRDSRLCSQEHEQTELTPTPMYVGSETHTGSGTQQTLNQEQRHCSWFCTRRLSTDQCPELVWDWNKPGTHRHHGGLNSAPPSNSHPPEPQNGNLFEIGSWQIESRQGSR